MKVAIHQPDFMPWIGFFAKMKKSDTFIILDHTENNPRDAAFWGRRVKIAVADKEQWLSVPLEKVVGRIGVPIHDMQLNLQNRDFIAQHLRTIHHNYAKTPFFKEVYPVIEAYFLMDDPLLIKRNMFFINWVKNQLQIEADIIYSSALKPTQRSNALLIELIKGVNGRTYISGDGAGGYMDLQQFADNDIEVMFNNFQHPIYSQHNTSSFIKGLSIFDAMMNIGFAKMKELLQKVTAAKS